MSSREPQTMLMDAFRRRDLGDFVYTLEFLGADVNLVEDSGLTIFQTILKTPNSADFIRSCINNDADCYTKTANNRYPLHYAIDSLCPGNLRAFLKNFDRSQINMKYNDENSLHILIDLLANDNYANVSESIKVLLKYGCNPNWPNDKNQTPFYRLLRKQTKLINQKELVEFFLDNSVVDLYTYRQDDMLKMFKAQNSHRKLPEQAVQNIDPKFMMSLVVQRKESDFESYFKAFKESCSNNAQGFQEECAKYLEMAAIKGAPNIVALILENVEIDLSVRANGATWKFPPSFVACMQGHFKIVEMFLKQPSLKFCFEKPIEFPLEKKSTTTLLHEVCLRFGREKTRDPNVDFQKCFYLLVEDRRCTPKEVINSQDSYGCTPLHYTTRYKNDEATMTLLKKSAYICTPNNLGQRALNDISKETFSRFLDDSVVTVNRRNKKTHMYVYGHDEQEISIDYSFLMPPEKFENREIAPLQLITKNKDLHHLIKHPVLFSFLYVKWSKLSLLFYINFFMFSLFMVSLIVYIVLCQSIHPDDRTKSVAYMFFYGLSIVSVLMLIVREILQCIFSVKHYFRSKMNWFEMCLIFLSCLVLLNLFDEDSQRVLRGITILLAATEFLTLAGTLPNLSVSTHMVILKTVILTFLKSIALYSILLFGFALCFFTIFGHIDPGSNNNSTLTNAKDDSSQNSFYNPGVAIIKTLVMLTGEFEFGNLEIHEASNYIIFVLFVFIIAIVLFNLLNALAVSDTQVIKSEGQLVDLMQRISVLNKYERIISNGNSAIARWLRGTINVFRFWIPTGKVVVFPDDDNNFIKTTRILSQNVGDVGAEELQTLNNNSPNESRQNYENIIVNNWLPSKFQKNASMDPKIMKAIKKVMEQKVQRQKEEDLEEYRRKTDAKILRDNISIKIQINHLQSDITSIKKHLNI